ncbi:hypothetical protein NSA24_11745, partial [Clostridioides mangenotii]|nr:hypothetical protein [Clostridioides mangenotii]
SQGHTIIDTKPSLIGIEVQEKFVASLDKLMLKNVSVDVYNSNLYIVYNNYVKSTRREKYIDEDKSGYEWVWKNRKTSFKISSRGIW